NDYIDLALTGEIYTKGSWGINAQSVYVRLYKFSGNFYISYITTILGDKGMPDYSKQTNFKLTWSHSQDRKANPNLTFSSSVNFSTSGYSHNNLTNYGNSTDFTTNTTSSSVSLSYNIPNSVFSIALTANVTQRNSDSTLNVSFPNLTINMSRVYPFKRKNRVGKEKWYEKISVTYTGNFKNSIQTKQNLFLKSNLIRDWDNGMQHSIPVSATFSVFKYINITPSFSFTDRMYTHRIMQNWDPQTESVVRDTVYGFYNLYNYSFSLSAQTKLYGYYRPLPFIGKKIPMIRHVLTPTIRVSGAPDFGASRFGYWQRYTRFNSNGTPELVYYSPFSGSAYGVPSQGKTGSVGLTLANNLEMKVNTDKDTTGVRKVSLIENLSASMSYNFAADSLNWSNLSTSLLIKLTKKFNLQVSATFDPYTYQLNSNGSAVKVNVPRWKAGKGFARLSNAGTSFSYTFNNSTFKRKSKSPPMMDDDMPPERPDDEILSNADRIGERDKEGREDKEKEELNMRDGYLVWEIPWSLSINYSISYSYGTFNKEKLEYNGKLNQNLSLSGNIQPAKNWSFSFSASYNFVTHKLAYMNCNLSRDMHCWSMSASFIPVGAYKSYNFSIRVKASILSDLKYDKSGNSYNGLDWY
ncbi:MAG: LPS-assembly protein LptD, partial [Porphyromonadaceae bacterium]|nr:LPS-assembly protein LptD [Porphyromonadaceae bacterium]